MILSACIPEPENPTIQLSETSQLAQVRDWFEANKTKLRLPDRGTNYRTESQELILPFFEKGPDWEQFHHYYFPDGREVFEVSLENENLYIPKAKDAGASEEYVDYFQNILFVKHPTLPKFDPLIIRYYPDKNTSNREFSEISYEMIDEKWSGWIDLFTYDEHYLMGYKVTEGELTHTREMQKNPENARKIAVSSENKSDEAIHCYPVATDWYDGRTGEYLDTTWAQTCEWQRGGSRSGGGRGDGGYEEEKPRGGADSPGGGCKKCYDPPEVPAPTLRVEIDQTVKDNPYLMCILKKLELSKFVNDLALFDGTAQNGRNVILKVGETENPEANAETNDDLGPYHIQIILNQNRLGRNSLEMARTFLHEMIHAELFRAIFHKNGTPLDRNFEANFAKYMLLYKGDAAIHHNYMAENMVNKMASVLSQIHSHLGKQSFLNDPDVIAAFPKGLPSGFYHGIAWNGLKWTDKWRYNLPERSSYEKYQKVGADNLTDNCNSN
ncbi:hypothetical protein OU792_16130 [Algoriphagus sp. NF]|uniref:hypothetical protein n=1 Tax=Algoriphagus sp. NF TaxID=2992756 RepID=UPI00237BCC66|nr:hypothetical protein [Algoriphagus sp. NF]MDE0561526.1 hypothetical protein [Algoriphagus sp. NF]